MAASGGKWFRFTKGKSDYWGFKPKGKSLQKAKQRYLGKSK
jgi:hypothetical protein